MTFFRRKSLMAGWLESMRCTLVQTLCEIDDPRVVFKDFQNSAKSAPFYTEKMKYVPVLDVSLQKVQTAKNPIEKANERRVGGLKPFPYVTRLPPHSFRGGQRTPCYSADCSAGEDR